VVGLGSGLQPPAWRRRNALGRFRAEGQVIIVLDILPGGVDEKAIHMPF